MHIRTYYIDARYLTWTTTYVRRSRMMVHMRGGGGGGVLKRFPTKRERTWGVRSLETLEKRTHDS